MNLLVRLFQYEGYEIRDVRVSTRKKSVEILLKPLDDKPFTCCRCATPLGASRGRHPIVCRELSIMGFETTVHVWRRKGECSSCSKVRSEVIPFVSKETPHLTAQLAEWLGTMCEFAPVSRVAKFSNSSAATLMRVDLKRMQRMLKTYKIPEVTRISVDEVYARKKPQHKGEKRDKRFFTVITDLDTKKVIWVTDSRNKEALDQFFELIGAAACKKIRVVATDQHDPYRASVNEYCPNAKVVWDRFHIMKAFNEAANEERKSLHQQLCPDMNSFFLTKGKFRYIFLKKPSRLSTQEKSHIDQVYLENSDFAKIEIIKERAYQFFDQQTIASGLDLFYELGRWIKQADFPQLLKWWKNLETNLATVQNYFEHKVTTAISEGTNNVIKALKRRAYGYRDMSYFKLKIMQVCGYLNSDFAGKQVVM